MTRRPRFLELDEVLEIHRDQVERYGGLAGIRDAALLNSAVAMPRSGAAAAYFHTDLFEMAAAYLFHIVKNHPFVDGNKRVGAVAALVFLDLNGIDMAIRDDDLFDIVIGVADGTTPKSAVAELLRRHSAT
jgi:death-on-curing protein